MMGDSKNVCGVPRPCPVCGGEAARRLFMNRMAPCAGYDFSAPIVQCAACGAAYAGTALPPQDLNRYYANFSKYDIISSASEVSSLDRNRAAMTTTFLAPIMGSIGSALDVGCSAGFLLSTLRAAGIARVQGIDPAAQAADVARSLFDVEVARAQAETYDRYGNFDLVCLMAVFEHLLEPRALLKAVARQLQPNARVLIEIPDAGAFDRPDTSEPLEPFGEFSNEHINFFSIGDIRKLAHGVGLEVERWKTVRHNGPPGLFALLKKADPLPRLPDPDPGSTPGRVSSVAAMAQYVAKSQLVMQDVERRLVEFRRSTVLLYGAGNHTCRLMAQSPALLNCRVAAVFDRNQHLHGMTIGNAQIRPPSSVHEYPELPIIVSTFTASRDVQTTLKAATAQPVVPLYN